MSRVKNQMRNTRVSGPVHINGRRLNIDFARLVYRCAECHGPLAKRGGGLICANDQTHRRFIHQFDVAAIEAERVKQLEQIETVYQIVDGQLVAKDIP